MLEKIFIKNYKDVENPVVRTEYATLAGTFGIITNVLLSAAKMVVGIIGNSFTIIADAMNNLSDAGGSLATIIGYKLSGKPADEKHPYGYARYEYITALIVAIMVFAIGVILGKSSVEKIIDSLNHEEITVVNTITYVILGIAIFGKLIQGLLYRRFGKIIDSDVLRANSIDSRNDIISTAMVLIASIIIDVVGNVGVSLDGIFGVLVSIFIIISSINLIKDTISPLLGEKPDADFVAQIKEKLLSYDGVLGIHDLMIHNYGMHKCFILVHIEVDANVDVSVSHDLIDNIERCFIEEEGWHLSVHMDPIVTDNKEVNEHKQRIIGIIQQLNSALTIHDFRMVFGTSHINILFDVVIPYSVKITEKEIATALNDAYSHFNEKYYFVLGFDRSYT